MVEIDSIRNTQMMIKQFNNVSAAIYSFNISGLTENTCYIFAVRAYTNNGYSEWVITVEKTLPEIVQHSPSFSEIVVPSITLSITSNTSASTLSSGSPTSTLSVSNPSSSK